MQITVTTTDVVGIKCPLSQSFYHILELFLYCQQKFTWKYKKFGVSKMRLYNAMHLIAMNVWTCWRAKWNYFDAQERFWLDETSWSNAFPETTTDWYLPPKMDPVAFSGQRQGWKKKTPRGPPGSALLLCVAGVHCWEVSLGLADPGNVIFCLSCWFILGFSCMYSLHIVS